jgi:hypothetical protein
LFKEARRRKELKGKLKKDIFSKNLIHIYKIHHYKNAIVPEEVHR